MKRILHLQHHHHTGKILAHKHTSYRGLFILVALFGVALLLVHRTVNADTFVATAKVPAPTPANAAVVEAPNVNSSVSTPSVTVTGSCSYVYPSSIVELYIGSTFVASGICQSDGTFSVPITLNPGLNQLVVRTVNITEDYGPDSSSISITYNPPAASSTQPNSTPTAGNQNGTGTPVIHSTHTYILYSPAKDAEWTGYIDGGVAPYTVTVDWGDGTSSNYSNVSTEPQSFRHTYSNYTSYTLSITVTDKLGTTANSHVAAATPYIPPATPQIASNTEAMLRIDQIIILLGYGTVATLILLGVTIVFNGQSSYVIARPPVKLLIPVRSHRRHKGRR